MCSSARPARIHGKCALRAARRAHPPTPHGQVSFYTPPNVLGAALDAYMGWENYHVEHHVRYSVWCQPSSSAEPVRRACHPSSSAFGGTRTTVPLTYDRPAELQYVSAGCSQDFPEMPMYLLPQLRKIAPEYYEALLSRPLLHADTWKEAWSGSYYYACQDEAFGTRTDSSIRQPLERGEELQPASGPGADL